MIRRPRKVSGKNALRKECPSLSEIEQNDFRKECPSLSEIEQNDFRKESHSLLMKERTKASNIHRIPRNLNYLNCINNWIEMVTILTMQIQGKLYMYITREVYHQDRIQLFLY